MYRRLVLSVLFFTLATGAYAATVYVPDDYPTIQDAINAAASGDTVIVRPGTYVENVDFLGKALTVKSEMGAHLTVIDGNNSGSAVSFVNGEGRDSVLEGFKITNGTGTFTAHINSFCGGGVYCFQSSPTISDNWFTLNRVAKWGGGIYCYDSTPKVRRNVFSSNMVGSGGGISCDHADAVIHRNIFTYNVATNGGGIHCYYSTPSIWGNSFSRNYADADGGAILLDESSPVVANNVISKNIASKGGGGGICCRSSSPQIVNDTLASNNAPGTDGGGGICATQGSSLWTVNTILWNDLSATGPEISILGSSLVTVSFSDLQGGVGSVYVEGGSTLDWGSGMIDADPLFVDSAGDDYHLTWQSPCGDAGDTAAVPADLKYDFEGDPRIVLGAVEIGADEFYFHLYYSGSAAPGSTAYVRVVGKPSMAARLLKGSGLLDPPVPSKYGYFYLEQPIKPFYLGRIPSNGVLSVPVVVPPSATSGEEFYFQGLVGGLGWHTTFLTNYLVVIVG